MNTNNSTFEQKLDSFNEKILGLSNKFDSYGVAGSPLKDRRLRMMVDFLVLFLYIGLLSFVTYFHEPWGDEAQSWAIAKYASYKDMIFFVGHGEGHPALWWLYLSFFAKSGLPFEFGLKAAAIILNALFAWLLIFKVQIPRIMKYFIPFTYFFFYQYGVISRCYSILIVAMVILALVWNDKEIKPYKTVFALILLCLSSAYGIAIAFALAVLWSLEIISSIIKNKRVSSKTKPDFKSYKHQISALLILLFAAVFIVALLFPTNDPYALRTEKYNSYSFRFFYMLMLEPIDSLFYMAEYIDTELYKYVPDTYSVVIGCIISVLFYVVIMFWPKAKNKRRYLVVPHLIFSCVAALSFFWSHHVGVTTALFLFWFIICYTSDDMKSQNTSETNSSNNILIKIKNIFKKAEIWMESEEAKLLAKLYWLIPILIIAVSIKWTIDSSIVDIKKNYAADRNLWKKIEELNLTNSKILPDDLALWTSYAGDGNNVYKIHIHNKDYSFAINNLTNDDTDEYFKYWAFNEGWPDIFVGGVSERVFDTILEINPELSNPPDYVPLHSVEAGMIFKGEYSGMDGWSSVTVYIKKDLFDSLKNQ